MSKSFQSPAGKKRQGSVTRFTSNDRWRLLGVVAFLAAAAVGLWLLGRSGSTKEVDRAIPAFLEADAAAGNFPATLAPAQFTDPSIKEAYAVALRIPRVLAQQPCYCWCSRTGHQSLLDCYRSNHAAECSICVKEAILASRLHDAGKTAKEIRTAIVVGECNEVK